MGHHFDVRWCPFVSHPDKMVSHMVSVRVPHVSGRDLRLWSHTVPSLTLVSALSEGDQEHGLKYYGHPMGKLDNDRYAPLHPPGVKCLLDEWMAHRGEGLHTRDLFLIHGRRLREGRVDGGVRRAARAASLEGEVTAHRLRHTLATQALNRGMSLVLLASLHPRRLKAPAGTSSAPPTHCTAGRIWRVRIS